MNLKLGCLVDCSAYIKHTKNHYEIDRDDESPGCSYQEYGATEVIEIEDFHSCDRFKKVECVFSGIYVGDSFLCTRINAEYWDDSNSGNSGFRTFCDTPETFAVVYYENNKKRLVPIDCIRERM